MRTARKQHSARLSSGLFHLACTTLLLGVAQAQVAPGGLPIPTYADFGDPNDQFGSVIDADGDWMVGMSSMPDGRVPSMSIGSRAAAGLRYRISSSRHRTPLVRGLATV